MTDHESHTAEPLRPKDHEKAEAAGPLQAYGDEMRCRNKLPAAVLESALPLLRYLVWHSASEEEQTERARGVLAGEMHSPVPPQNGPVRRGPLDDRRQWGAKIPNSLLLRLRLERPKCALGIHGEYRPEHHCPCSESRADRKASRYPPPHPARSASLPALPGDRGRISNKRSRC